MTLENAKKFAEEAKSYKRYVLTKPFKTKINTAGAVGAFAFVDYSKKVGDVVEGALLSGPNLPAGTTTFVQIVPTLKVPVGEYSLLAGGATPYVYIPLSYLKPEPMTIKQPIAEIQTKIAALSEEETNHFGLAGSSLGFAYGLYHAYKKQSGFWGYVGWAILFSVIGGAVGSGINYTINAIKK